MTTLTIVANVYAKADQIELVKGAAVALVAVTRRQEGCIRYDLHQDNENPAHFLFYEDWDSRASLQKHMNSQYVKCFFAVIEGAIEPPVLNEMTRIT